MSLKSAGMQQRRMSAGYPTGLTPGVPSASCEDPEPCCLRMDTALREKLPATSCCFQAPMRAIAGGMEQSHNVNMQRCLCIKFTLWLQTELAAIIPQQPQSIPRCRSAPADLGGRTWQEAQQLGPNLEEAQVADHAVLLAPAPKQAQNLLHCWRRPLGLAGRVHLTP